MKEINNKNLEDTEDYCDEEDECFICGGEGFVETDDPLWDGFGAIVPCSSCRGSGLKKDMIWC